MATITIPFRNFADGEYGTLDSSLVGFALYRQRMLYKGYWTGQNVVRTVDGHLCPRAGMKAYTLTGVANGVLNGMGYNAPADVVWFSDGTTVYSFDPTVFTAQALTAYAGALGAFTEPLTFVELNAKTYVSCYSGSGIYVIDHLLKTVTAVASSPAGFATVAYGDRMLTAAANRVYFSAAGDYTSWPAANYFDVGDATNVTSMTNIRGRLAITKSVAGQGAWWLLSGVPGVNATLRQAEASLGPWWALQAVDTGGGVGLVSQYDNVLSLFNGVSLSELQHLKVISDSASRTGLHTAASAFPLRQRGEWGFVADHTVDEHDTTVGSVWLFHNGAWSRHKRDVVGTINAGGYSASSMRRSLVIFGEGGDGSHPPTFHALNPYIERPPFTTDRGATVLDPSTVTFTLPEWSDVSGDDVAVRAVIVDFTSWNTGDSNSNTWSLHVTTTRVDGTGADQTGDTATWAGSTASAATTGTAMRETVPQELVYGGGFQLTFTGLRGVSIRSVVVVAETRPMSLGGGE